MEKVYDVIGVENPIMDFAVSIDRLPRTDFCERDVRLSLAVRGKCFLCN